MGRIIAIMSGKGGVGKTTLTASLGAALNRAGHRVLITDADFGMRDLDLVVGKENDIFFDAIDIWKENCTSDYAILPLHDNFDFLPATQSRRWEDVGRKGYAKLIKGLAKQYDYVIIDAPAGIGRGNEAIFKAADQIILVAEPIWVSLRAVQRVMQMCREVRQLNYMVVLNNVGHSTAEVPLEEALVSLQVEHLGTILPYRHMIQSWSQEGLLHEGVDAFFDHMMKALVKAVVSDTYMDEEDLLNVWHGMVHRFGQAVDMEQTVKGTGAQVDSNRAHQLSEGVAVQPKDSTTTQAEADATVLLEGESTVQPTEGATVQDETDATVLLKDESAVQPAEGTIAQSEGNTTVPLEDESAVQSAEGTTVQAEADATPSFEDESVVQLAEDATVQTNANAEAVTETVVAPVMVEKKKGGLASLLRRQLTSLWSRRGRMR